MPRRDSKAYKRLRKQQLWVKQEGLCHYCEKPMMHWEDLRTDPCKIVKYGVVVLNGILHIKRPPKELATLEHLIDRYDPRRQTPPNGEKRWALACQGCNHKRGEARTKQRGIEDARARSERRR